MSPTIVQRWQQRAQQLKQEIYAIALAYRDPRVPWYAKLVAACVVAYAFSPIDLIPDPIPVLGYLDDLLLLPLGIALSIKLIPPALLAECRERAQAAGAPAGPRSRLIVVIIVAVWLLLATVAVAVTVEILRSWYAAQ